MSEELNTEETGSGCGRRESLPTVVRARGYRLYDERGRRYIDFYQNGGRALLGHRPPGLSQALKSTLDRGLLAEYPGRESGRLGQLLKERFRGVERVLPFRSLPRACEAGGGSPADLTFAEGREHCRGERAVPLWRPGALDDGEEQRLLAGEWGGAFVPLLPFPGSFAPAALCLLPGAEAALSPDPVSPLLEKLLVKCAAAMQKWEEAADSEKWEYFDCPGIERRGPYFRVLAEEGEYRQLQRRLLERGVLLPPERKEPAVIPGEYTSGEVKPLRKELSSLYGHR